MTFIRQNELTATVNLHDFIEVEDINLKIDQIRNSLQILLKTKLAEQSGFTKSAAYTLTMLSLTEFIKNVLDKKNDNLQISIVPVFEQPNRFIFYTIDNGSEFKKDFLDKDLKREENGLANYENILDKSDVILSPKTKGKDGGGSGRALAQLDEVIREMRNRNIPCYLKIGNLKPQGAIISIESQTQGEEGLDEVQEVFTEITTRFTSKCSRKLSFVPIGDLEEDALDFLATPLQTAIDSSPEVKRSRSPSQIFIFEEDENPETLLSNSDSIRPQATEFYLNLENSRSSQSSVISFPSSNHTSSSRSSSGTQTPLTSLGLMRELKQNPSSIVDLPVMKDPEHLLLLKIQQRVMDLTSRADICCCFFKRSNLLETEERELHYLEDVLFVYQAGKYSLYEVLQSIRSGVECQHWSNQSFHI